MKIGEKYVKSGVKAQVAYEIPKDLLPPNVNSDASRSIIYTVEFDLEKLEKKGINNPPPNIYNAHLDLTLEGFGELHLKGLARKNKKDKKYSVILSGTNIAPFQNNEKDIPFSVISKFNIDEKGNVTEFTNTGLANYLDENDIEKKLSYVEVVNDFKFF